jgi:hypothetical protein
VELAGSSTPLVTLATTGFLNVYNCLTVIFGIILSHFKCELSLF